MIISMCFIAGARITDNVNHVGRPNTMGKADGTPATQKKDSLPGKAFSYFCGFTSSRRLIRESMCGEEVFN